MITPQKTEYYVMELFSHGGPESLDSIATRVYGRTYVGSRAMGDSAPGNDSWITFDMTEGSWQYEEGIEEFDSETTTTYNEKTYETETFDQSPLDYWLGLTSEPPYYYSEEQKAAWDPGEDRDVQEKAPDLEWVLADLIRRGELPHGHYLLRHWW